jgi:hypothetical protein
MVLAQQQAPRQQQMSKRLWQHTARGSLLQLYMQHYSSSSSRMRWLAAWGWMLLLKHWQQMRVATCRAVELLPLG